MLQSIYRNVKYINQASEEYNPSEAQRDRPALNDLLFDVALDRPSVSISSETITCRNRRYSLQATAWATVAAFEVSPHGLSRNIPTRFWVFGSECHVKKEFTFFLTLKIVFLRSGTGLRCHYSGTGQSSIPAFQKIAQTFEYCRNLS
jgi:hypothetical protein